MKRGQRWVGVGYLGIALMAGGAMACLVTPQAQGAQGQAAAPAYTRPEYDAMTAERSQKDPMMKLMMLDDFVMKYPMSTLMVYIDSDYYNTYGALKNWPKTIEYADKLLAFGDKVDAAGRLAALYARAQAYAQGSSDKSLQTPEAFMAAGAAASQGLQVLAQLPKPASLTDAAFTEAKKSYVIVFNEVAGTAESGLKDYKAAVDSYKAALALAPMDAPTHYFLGVAYLQEMPPDSLNGFWELSRAIALKIPSDAQVRMFLRNRIAQYQGGAVCDNLVDGEVNDIIMAAGAAADRPATLTLPGADDLMKARDDTANFVPWLLEGGDHGKVMWLAVCGLEYPDFPVWVMDVQPGDGGNTTLQAYRPAATDPDAAQKETEAATAPNVVIHVTDQPDVQKVMKDNSLRFTGTLTGYTQSPFLLTFDNAKVNADDLKDLLTPAPGKKPARGGRAAPRGSGQ